MASGKISLREIARQTGVSATTVSKIVRNEGSFSEETRRRIFDALERAHYDFKEAVPQGYRESRKKIVGIVTADYENEFFSELITAITLYFRKLSYSVIASGTARSPEEENNCIRTLYQAGASGIIIISSRNHTPDLPEGLPAVFLESPLDLSDSLETRFFVSSDNYVGGQLAAREFIKKGCTRPLIMNNRNINLKENERIRGFIHDFEKAGIKIPESAVHEMDSSVSGYEGARNLVTYLFTKGEAYDCIFATNDWRAFGALEALRAMNIPVPESVKIIGYDGIRISHCTDTPLTTIRQNISALSDTASEMLNKLMNNEPVSRRQVLLPITLQAGSTT